MIFTTALIVPALLSVMMWVRYQERKNPVEVVVVQPSHDPYERIEKLSDTQARIQYMIDLAETAISPSTAFVVAPEGANPRGIWMHEEEEHVAVVLLREHLSRHHGMAWVLGSFSYRIYHAHEPRPPSASPFIHGNKHYDVYNSAIMIEGERPLRYYHKSKLVPGIEQMPFHRYLAPLGKLVSKLGGTQGSLGTQASREVFRSEDGVAIAPMVCYESIYGAYAGEYYRNGAQISFIITNDGWWRNTPGHRQHFAYARLRAIESRRSIARAASTGISGFIDQRGRVLQKTSWWESTAISATLHQNHSLTFYSRNGNFLGKLSLFLAVLLLAYMLSQRAITRKRGNA